MNPKSMAMTYKARDPEALAYMNMTPLIDVMLVLITILIITIPIQRHAVNIYLPVCGDMYFSERLVNQIYIDFDGALYWNGSLMSPEAVDVKLRLLGAAPGAEQSELRVKPNRLASYGIVAGVLAATQRNKVANVEITSSEQFM